MAELAKVAAKTASFTTTGVIERLLTREALRNEAVLSAIRLTFIVGLTIRYFAIGSHVNDAYAASRNALALSATAVALLFSSAVLVQYRRGRLTLGWLAVSVLLDVALSTAGLAANLLFPGDLYRGVLDGADLAGFLVAMVAAGFRLSVRLALLGGAASLVAGVLLVIGDVTLCPVPVPQHLQNAGMWLLLGASATSVAVALAWRTRSLVAQGARQTERLERVRHGFELLLHSHHDAQAVLSAATLNADLLLREIAGDAATRRRAELLREDISILHGYVQGLKQGADGELLAALDAGEVTLDEEVGKIVERVRPWIGNARLAVDLGAGAARIVIAGGARGLARIMMNLLANARDAAPGESTRIEVATSLSASAVVLTVADDGPGMTGIPPPGSSSKPAGTGVGLSVVSTIVAASGGRLAISPAGAAGGTRIEISLPAA